MNHIEWRHRLWWVPLAASMLLATGIGVYAHHVRSQYHLEVSRAAMYRDLFDNSHSAVIVTNEDGDILDWSNGATRLLGWSPNEARGANIRLIMPPEQQKLHAAAFAASREHWKDLPVRSFQCWVVRQDGQLIRTKVSVRCVNQLNDDKWYFVALLDPIEDFYELPAVPAPGVLQEPPPNIDAFKTEEDAERAVEMLQNWKG